MKAIALTLLLLFPLAGLAQVTATVDEYKGDVLYNGKEINNDTVFNENGFIEVKADSYLKLKVEVYNSTMALGPNSKLQLKFKKKKKMASPYIFINGLLRWVTQGKSKRKGFIRTKMASLGVRGTDFLIIASSLLGESEIYCFDGKVVFANRKSKKDQVTVKPSDWAGIGGRFGETVGDIVPMTEEQISHVKGLIE